VCSSDLKAFEAQLGGHGLGLVELLSSCNVNWGMSPGDALKWIDSNMVPVYPLGVFKDWSEAGAEAARFPGGPAAASAPRADDDELRAEVAG